MTPVRTRCAGRHETQKTPVSWGESQRPGAMEGAGDAGSPCVPPGQFASWKREISAPETVPPYVIESVKQMMMNSGKTELAEVFKQLDPSVVYPYYCPDMEDDDDDTYEDEEYEDVSDYEDDDDNNILHFTGGSTFCGFPKSFLNSQAPKTTSNNPFLNLKMPMQHIVTPEEAERNANELVAEEERIKNKAEKKKLKKQRQKDRKRQQKLEEDLKNKKKEIKNNKREVQNGSGDVSSIKEIGKEEKGGVSSSVVKGHSASNERGGIIEAPPPPASTCSENTEDSDEEEFHDLVDLDAELDMASSFVNQVMRKVENKPKVERIEKNNKNEAKISEKSPNKSPTKLSEQLQMKQMECMASINPMQQCMEFAALGNNMANGGHFAAAVVYFTEAIKLNPRDYRLFGNRSYCWERMGRFNEALGDAEVSISLEPTFLKGYFRKGKSLMGMKNYTDAMLAFNHILRKESTHVDAALQLKECQRLQQRAVLNSKNIVKMPDLVPTHQDFRQPSPGRQTECGSLVSAMSGMSLDATRTSKQAGDYPVLITTSGPKPNVPATLEKSAKSTTQPVASHLPQKPVFTPCQLYPVWVGNVTTRITAEVLLAHFKKFGAVHSVRILYDRTCAFVNYASKEAAEAAYSKLQGAEVEGTTFLLQLRHPDHASNTTSGRKTAKEGVKADTDMECHFWRTTGCNNGDRCRFRHIQENRGIDAN